ncbi:type II toxin-antitoxin system PemK/MazF family toxin, partial [Blautia massiliensis (ex Durand et al. 2017)]
MSKKPPLQNQRFKWWEHVTTNKHRQVLHGQIWFCDLGYNIGTEKNKMRPVLVMSNNKINNS